MGACSPNKKQSIFYCDTQTLSAVQKRIEREKKTRFKTFTFRHRIQYSEWRAQEELIQMSIFAEYFLVFSVQNGRFCCCCWFTSCLSNHMYYVLWSCNIIYPWTFDRENWINQFVQTEFSILDCLLWRYNFSKRHSLKKRKNRNHTISGWLSHPSGRIFRFRRTFFSIWQKNRWKNTIYLPKICSIRHKSYVTRIFTHWIMNPSSLLIA